MAAVPRRRVTGFRARVDSKPSSAEGLYKGSRTMARAHSSCHHGSVAALFIQLAVVDARQRAGLLARLHAQPADPLAIRRPRPGAQGRRAHGPSGASPLAQGCVRGGGFVVLGSWFSGQWAVAAALCQGFHACAGAHAMHVRGRMHGCTAGQPRRFHVPALGMPCSIFAAAQIPRSSRFTRRASTRRCLERNFRFHRLG